MFIRSPRCRRMAQVSRNDEWSAQHVLLFIVDWILCAFVHHHGNRLANFKNWIVFAKYAWNRIQEFQWTELTPECASFHDKNMKITVMMNKYEIL